MSFQRACFLTHTPFPTAYDRPYRQVGGQNESPGRPPPSSQLKRAGTCQAQPKQPSTERALAHTFSTSSARIRSAP